MTENTIERFDMIEAKLQGQERSNYLVIDGEKALKRALPIISIPLVKEKMDRFHLYVDCPIGDTVYLAAMDGIVQVPREALCSKEPVGSLTDEKAKKTIEDTFRVMLNM